jgi:segregation and condensation protein A
MGGDPDTDGAQVSGDGAEIDGFEDAPPATGRPFIVDLDGFEGPIDLLLGLARDHKVDLTRISILALADQYLTYIEHARQLRLEVAADYLVMAAWLAYLKSRLLLPAEATPDDEPSAAEMAEALQFQMRRLEAMQDAAARLIAQPQLGADTFARGRPDGIALVAAPTWEASLFDLLKAYGDQLRRSAAPPRLTIDAGNLFSVEMAVERLRARLVGVPEWRVLSSFLPDGLRDGLTRRSAVAATFAASLELAKSGSVRIRQDRAFGPIFVRGETASSGEE